jgi:hypothetical protein
MHISSECHLAREHEPVTVGSGLRQSDLEKVGKTGQARPQVKTTGEITAC